MFCCRRTPPNGTFLLITRAASRSDEPFRKYKKKIFDQIRNKDAVGALQFYREMKELQIHLPKKNVTSFLLSLCYEHKEYKVAKEIFRDCLQVPDVSQQRCDILESIFPIMIRFAAGEGDFTLCLDMLRVMESLHIPLKGRNISPIISSLLSACTAEHARSALTLMLNMLKRGLVPRHEDFADLFITGCKLQLFDDADFLSKYRLMLSGFVLLDRSLNQKCLERMSSFSSDRAVLVTMIENKCPNCSSTVKLFDISNDEAARLYTLLQDIIINDRASTSTVQEFREFIQMHGPYDFIVDGANVAYWGQNHAEGKFSYSQIMLVYRTLKQIYGDACRVLVIVPGGYASALYQNRVSTVKGTKLTSLEESDWSVIETLTSEDAFYPVVDRGVDDDWIWITAMLYGGDKDRVPMLVSNDLMRDHRLAIAEPLLYKKWIEAQVMRFCLEIQNNEDTIVFKRESLASREIQETELGSNIWHIPASEGGDVWLCLDTRPSAVQRS